VITFFEMSDKQSGFGLQLPLDKIKVFPLQNQIFWDGCDLCINHPIMGLPLHTSPYLWYWTVVNRPGP
jgi:hypothetical protein